MFTNPGSKIKSYAKIVFWIGAIVSIILGIIVIVTGIASATSYVGFSFGRMLGGLIGGVLTAAIGIVVSWVSVLALYGFGTLVENSDTLVKLNGGQPSGEKDAEKVQLPKVSVQTAPQQPYQMNVPQQTSTASKVCPHCGEPVEADAHFCRNCGERID